MSLTKGMLFCVSYLGASAPVVNDKSDRHVWSEKSHLGMEVTRWGIMGFSPTLRRKGEGAMAKLGLLGIAGQCEGDWIAAAACCVGSTDYAS